MLIPSLSPYKTQRERRAAKKMKKMRVAAVAPAPAPAPDVFGRRNITRKVKVPSVIFEPSGPTKDIMATLFGNGIATGSYPETDIDAGAPTELKDMCLTDTTQAHRLVAFIRALRTENTIPIKKRVKATWRAPVLVRGPSGSGKSLLVKLASKHVGFESILNVTAALDSAGRLGTTVEKRSTLASLMHPPFDGVLTSVAVVDDMEALTTQEQRMVLSLLERSKLTNTTPFVVIVTDPVDTRSMPSDVWKKLRALCQKTTVYLDARTEGEIEVALKETQDKAPWASPLRMLNTLSQKKAVTLAARSCKGNLRIGMQTLNLFALDVMISKGSQHHAVKGFQTPSIPDASYDLFNQTETMLFTPNASIDKPSEVFLLAETLMNGMAKLSPTAMRVFVPSASSDVVAPTRPVPVIDIGTSILSDDDDDDDVDDVFRAPMKLPPAPPAPPKDTLGVLSDMLDALATADMTQRVCMYSSAAAASLYVAAETMTQTVNTLYPVRPRMQRLGNIFPFHYVQLTYKTGGRLTRPPREFGLERWMSKAPRKIKWNMGSEFEPQVKLLMMPPHNMPWMDAVYALLSSVSEEERLQEERKMKC